MTLDTAHSKEIYQGNGNTTEFPFFFKVWDAAQIAVTVTDAAGSSVDVTTQCAIALNDGGGSVGYLHAGAPLPVGATLAITRNMPFTQGVDLVSASRFDPQVIEDALDQATAERQQTLEMMQRAVILPATSAETPQDVVRAVYAARDDAQTANSEAQAAMNTAANSATAAAASAAGAAGDADLARRWASEAEDVPVQAGEFSARHYSEKAKEAVPENLVGRVETLEGRTAPATTTSRGIGRVATLADMEPGAVIENGPAFPDVQGGAITTTPTAHAVPQADGDGTLNNWSGARFAACATASATSAKVATLDNFELKKGSRVFVTFSSANTVAGALTLNVNGTGVKSVYDESGAAVSAANPAYFPAGCKIEFVYDGTNWIFINRVVKRYYSSTMKARMYADGYKHQGGTLSVASNRTVTISFPFAFLDTTYTAQRNVGIQSAATANTQESCCFDLTTTTMQTQVNTDHTYARWTACGY